MRHTGFPQVDSGQRDPRELEHHRMDPCKGMYIGYMDRWTLWGQYLLC